MKRLLVVGCCGSGKSTFSRALGERTGLPVVHLDQHYWRPGWVETPDDEWPEVVEGLIAEDRWIIDGNFGGTLPARLERADTVVHLDLPRSVCMRSVILRVIKGYGRTRPDLAPDCPERFDAEFIAYVWNFHRTQRPPVVEQLERFRAAGGRVEIARSRRDADALLDTLPRGVRG